MAVVPARPIASTALYRELTKIIDLPPTPVALTLRLATGEIASVTCTYMPELKSGVAEQMTRRFGLYEIKEPESGPGTAHPPQRP